MLSDWLAAIGGGAAAVDQAKTDDENRQLANRRIDAQENAATIRADVMQMIANAKIGSTEKIAGEKNATQRDIATGKNDTAKTIAELNDFGRTRRTDKMEAGLDRRADQTNDTNLYRIDLGDQHAWDNAARDLNKFTQRDDTVRRGQELEHGDRQDALGVRRDENADARRARTAIGVLALQARKKPGLFGEANPTDYAAGFDRLYNDPSFAASQALDAGDGSDAGAASAPPSLAAPPVVPPAAVGPRPRVPVRQRPAPGGSAGAVPGASAPAAPPKGLQPGATVTLKSGKKVKVTKVNPDGTFDHD